MLNLSPINLPRRDVVSSINIGVFVSINEDYAIVPRNFDDKARELIAERLDVEVISTSINGSNLIGSLVVGNSRGFLVSRYATDLEIEPIKKVTRVERLPDRMNACGNLILVNDKSALVHPELSNKSVQLIEEFLGVSVYKGCIGGYNVVGKAAAVTDKGLLVNPYVKEEDDIKDLEKIFDVSLGVGTINFGSPLIGSGLIVNSKGYIVGSNTTGPEIARVEEVFQLI
ncbi:MAG TPA: translation initiation factor IF-6 [Halobacteria archaeon]|nr:translation initiation factor IF-6 [Halobacteria archaeon]HIH78616.1 translation initiation factor IF-6 [Halobacteria archaeon]